MTTLAAQSHASSSYIKEDFPDGVVVHYKDAPSLRTERRTIFENRIYDFTTDADRPLIIDGGAHIGMAAIRWKSLYPSARIVCFEPDKIAFDLLNRNIASNNLTDIEPIQAGLSDRDGIVAFSPDGSDGGRIVPEYRKIAASNSIRTVKLSGHITEPVEMLKLNIEGQEWPVLRELEQSGKLALVRKVILEYHGWAGDRQCLGDILNLLDRSGFRYMLHDFDQETNPSTKPPFRIRSNSPWFCLVYAEQVQVPPSTKPHSLKPVDWGELRRVTPISRTFGYDRGMPIDRFYIEKFLASHAAAIQGRVLEIGDNTYTQRFGADRVVQSDVLHAAPGNRHATIVGDLATGRGIPTGSFDCIILTQTLLCIKEVPAAIDNAFKALRPGGVLLATVPGISQISRYDMDRWGDYWRFTTLSAISLFGRVFGNESIAVHSHGNVLAATAFLQGICTGELSATELDETDPDYQLVITIRGDKAR